MCKIDVVYVRYMSYRETICRMWKTDVICEKQMSYVEDKCPVSFAAKPRTVLNLTKR